MMGGEGWKKGKRGMTEVIITGAILHLLVLVRVGLSLVIPGHLPPPVIPPLAKLVLTW